MDFNKFKEALTHIQEMLEALFGMIQLNKVKLDELEKRIKKLEDDQSLLAVIYVMWSVKACWRVG